MEVQQKAARFIKFAILIDRKLLIEKTDGLFLVQPVVMECVTERFIQQVYTAFETAQIDILRSHTLVQVHAKDDVREIQLRWVVQPVIERLLYRFGNMLLTFQISLCSEPTCRRSIA